MSNLDKLKDKLLFRQKCYLGGVWTQADSKQSIDVHDPANGEVLGSIPNMGADETRNAIAAAEAALPAWRGLVAAERSSRLRRWFELMHEHIDDLALIMTLEQGKPIAESKGEIKYAAAFLEWFAEEAKRIYGDVIPQPQADKRVLVLKQPIGVVAAITPWNFPAAMITRKAGPALAAGCTVVCKPATATPYSALALAELAERAGIPPGVFNVVTGSARHIGGELTRNPAVRKLTFTGSTAVGKMLLEQCAATVKKCSMELGGNAPFIVFSDADLDSAIEGVMASKFRNAGQTCVCTNRIYVQDAVYDAFVDKLEVAMATLKVGNGTEEGVTQGPLIDAAAVDTIEQQIADVLKKNGKLVSGGKRHALGGSFFEPTLMRDVTQDMRVATEETFGPLAALIRFDTEEQVIKMANDSEFGLAAYFYASDIHRIWRVAEGIEAGMVAVNTGILSTEVAPFGGVKESGLGREGSKYGIEEFVETKYLCLGGF